MLSLWHLLTFFPLSFILEEVSLCHNLVWVSVGLSCLRLWLLLSCQIECFPQLFLHIPSSCSLFHFRDRRRGLRPPRPISWLPGHLFLTVCVLCTFQTSSFARLRLAMTFPGWLFRGVVPVLTDFLSSGSLSSKAAHPGISTRESESVFTVALEPLGCGIVSPPSVWPPVTDVFFLPVPSR